MGSTGSTGLLRPGSAVVHHTRPATGAVVGKETVLTGTPKRADSSVSVNRSAAGPVRAPLRPSRTVPANGHLGPFEAGSQGLKCPFAQTLRQTLRWRMPSFQTRLKITGLKPGNPPEAVMAAAVEALGTRHHVESNQLELAGGVPQLNLRFLVEATEYSGENNQARESAAMMRDAVERVAVTGSLLVLRRNRGRWAPV